LLLLRQRKCKKQRGENGVAALAAAAAGIVAATAQLHPVTMESMQAMLALNRTETMAQIEASLSAQVAAKVERNESGAAHHQESPQRHYESGTCRSGRHGGNTNNIKTQQRCEITSWPAFSSLWFPGVTVQPARCSFLLSSSTTAISPIPPRQLLFDSLFMLAHCPFGILLCHARLRLSHSFAFACCS